jgi:hypothetical protein
MLAMEFAWAEAALVKALAQAEKAQAATKQASTAQKLATAGLIVLVVAAALVAIFAWDITVPVINPS